METEKQIQRSSCVLKNADIQLLQSTPLDRSLAIHFPCNPGEISENKSALYNMRVVCITFSNPNPHISGYFRVMKICAAKSASTSGALL